MSSLLHRFDGYDELKPLLAAGDEDVLARLGKPALIRIPGTDPRPSARLVSCLLHGNEDSGYRAVLAMLREGAHYPFDLWVLIGNVRAASTDGWFAHRHLDDQEDFNRVWGRRELTTRLRRCAAEVLDVLSPVDLQAAVDLHNNTGQNPFFAIVPDPTAEALALAATCTDKVLLWHLDAHTLMQALMPSCPAIAVECGLAGIDAHADFASDVLDRFLTAEGFNAAHGRLVEVFEMRARVAVRSEVAFAFGGALTDDLDLLLRPGLDGANFGMLLAGSELGSVEAGTEMPLEARAMDDTDVTARYFQITPDGRLLVREDVTPVMMTTTVQQARRDCLFYIARRQS